MIPVSLPCRPEQYPHSMNSLSRPAYIFSSVAFHHRTALMLTGALLTLTACHHRGFRPPRTDTLDRSKSISSTAPAIRRIGVVDNEGNTTVLHSGDSIDLQGMQSPLRITAEAAPEIRRIFFRIRKNGGPSPHRILFDGPAVTAASQKSAIATTIVPASIVAGEVSITAVPYELHGRGGKPMTVRVALRSSPATNVTGHDALREAIGIHRDATKNVAAGNQNIATEGEQICKANMSPVPPGAPVPAGVQLPPKQAPADGPECRALQGSKGKLMIICSHPFDRARRAYAFRTATKAHVCDFLNVVSPSVATCEGSDDLVEEIKRREISVAFEDDESAAAVKPPHIIPISVR